MGNSSLPTRLLAHSEYVLSKATEFQFVGVREVEACCCDVDQGRPKGWICRCDHAEHFISPREASLLVASHPQDGEPGLETKSPRGWIPQFF